MTPADIMQWFPVACFGLLIIAGAGALVFAGINMYHLSKSDKK